MISSEEKRTIKSCAARYGVRRILLFGSALESDSGYADIDIAVDGLAPHLFFKFYGELIRGLDKPVDVVDLEDRTPFTEHIAREGVKLYG